MMRSLPALAVLVVGLFGAPLPWLDETRALRCLVTLPAPSRPLENALVSVRDDLSGDPAVLGLATALAPDSLKIVEVDPSTGKALGNPTGIPYTREGGVLFWQAAPGSAAGKTFAFYYNLATHPRTGERWGGATMETPKVFAQAPDYAREKLGHAWDFDDGEFAGIYAWGDTPQAIQNKKVEGGILSFDAVGDAWFTWGSMFTENPWISLDPAVYNLLLIRMRQNVASAPWQLFCLDGNKQIRQYAFTVTGKDWQMLRFDIPTELRWKGPLKSLRIDPTDKLKNPAHVEIDWVRVVTCLPAVRGSLEARFENAQPRALRLEVPSAATVGEAFPVRAVLTDAAGKPAGFVDLTLRLASKTGGVARQWRALTGAASEMTLPLSNTLAGAFTLTVSATLAPTVTAEKSLVLRPAAAVACVVDPGTRGTWYPAGKKWVVCAREGEKIRLDVRLKDAFGNLVPESASAIWEGLEGGTPNPEGAAFKDGLLSLVWDATRSTTLTVERRDGSIACECKAASESSGVNQSITLDQKEARPISFSAESRAEGVSGDAPSADYGIYVDLVHADGSRTYGLSAPFKPGTHEWEKASLTHTPTKPVKTVLFYMLLRKKTGKAWFRNPILSEGAPTAGNAGANLLKAWSLFGTPGASSISGALRSAPVYVQVSPRFVKRVGAKILPNGYFGFADGRVFFPLGGHYANWPGKAPDFKANIDFFPCNISPFLMPVPFDKQAVDALRAWFAHMKGNGVNTLRLMLRNMDLVGVLDKAQMAAVREYVNLAAEYGLHFVVVLMEDFSKPPYINRKLLEQIILPRYPGADFTQFPAHRARFLAKGEPVEDRYLDADVIRCQKEYLIETLPWLGDLPNVFCYELENEMYHAAGTWIDEMTKTIKKIDPDTLVTASTGGGGLDSGDPYWFTAKTLIDAYTYHQYPNGALKARAQSKERCPALTDDDLEFGNIVSTLVRVGRACPKPTFYGEVGWYDDYFKLGETPDYLLRDLVWFGMIHNPGHLFWLTPGNESAAYKPVAAILAKLDLASFKRDAGERVVDATHEPGKDYYYYQTNKADYWNLLMHNRRALDSGVRMDFAMEKKPGAVELANPDALTPSKRSLSVAKGYQADAMSGNGGERWLIYLRNYAGTVEVPNKPTAGGYARTKRACDLSLNLDLPGKKYLRTLVDLNEGASTESEVAGKHALSIKNTDHDYVIVLRGK